MKRLLTSILAFVLVISTLTACASQNSGSRTPLDSNETTKEVLPEVSPGTDPEVLAEGIKRLTNEWARPVVDRGVQFEHTLNFFAEDSDERALLDKVRDFHKRSFKEQAQDFTEDNLLMSPLSLYLALAMLGEGTDGETRAEIDLALAGESGDGDVLSSIRAPIQSLLKGMNVTQDPFQMMTGQSMWLSPRIPIKESYLDLLNDVYATDLFQADFVNQKDVVKAEMSKWISEQTAGLLGEELPFELSSDDAFYLMQTLYLKDNWIMPFDPDLSSDDAFTTRTGEKKDVKFMYQTQIRNLGYGGDTFSAAELVTTNGLVFRVILPKDVLSPAEILALEDLDEVLYSDHLLAEHVDQESPYWKLGYEINWSFPQFDVQTTVDLEDLLKNLGIEEVMGAGANFSRAADVEEGTLFLETAKQQVRLNADEVGFEAAGLTALGAGTVSMPEIKWRLDMNMNRPFLFTISTRLGLPLFIGYIGDASN